MTSIPFAAALLVGGRSTRMGREKALLPWEGEPLIERQLRTLRSLGPARLLLSARPEQDFPVEGVEIVTDPLPERGPLGGLAGCLVAMQTPLLVVLAIDMPQVPSAYLQLLLETATESCGVVPEIAGGMLEPLAAVYPRTLLPLALDHLAGNDGAMHRFVQRGIEAGMLRAVPVSEMERPYFLNLNRPHDLPPEQARHRRLEHLQ